jgi:competence protein ComEC
MKRPMLVVAAFFIAGILCADPWAPGSAIRLAALLIGVGLTSLLALGWARIRIIGLATSLFLAGAASLELQRTTLSTEDVRTLAPSEPTLATVRGQLRETPVYRLYTHQDEISERSQAELQLTAVRWNHGPWRPACGMIVVSTPGVLPGEFHGGRKVEIEGVWRRPPGPLAPGGFDYAAHLRRRGIHFQLRCDRAADWRLLKAAAPDSTRPPLADRFGAWAKQTLARGLPEQDAPLELLWAMTLGWRTALTGEVSEPFMRSGTMHVFAISGLHITLIAFLFVTVLRVCQVPRRWCALLIIPLLWLYTGLTGWQASAVRSTVMTSVVVAGWLLARPSDLLNSLAAAAFLILAWDPQQLFQAGFQLSFAVVLSLALLGPWLETFRVRIFQFDPWVPDDLRPRWQRWLRRPINYVSTNLAVAVAAWLGSLPLVAAYFNLLTPVSLLANLLVVPLSGGALACSLGSLLIGPFVPAAGELFNHSAWFFMLLMIRCSEWAAALPLGWLYVPAPSFLFMVVYYGALLGMLAGIFQRTRWRWWFGGALTTLALLAGAQFLHHRSQTRLTLLPLNGGAAAYLTSPDRGSQWLIDCGDASSADFVLKPYLRSQGVNRIENLLLTHGDVHHAGGVEVLCDNFRLKRAWLSTVPFRSSVYRAAREQLETLPHVVHSLQRGMTLPPWTVLHPDDSDRFPQADDNAVVLLGIFGTNRVLLLSDLGKPGQNQLLNRYPNLRADLVVSGIPVQSEPLADSFLEIIQPRLIVVADAQYPATQRASVSLRTRLSRQSIPVLYTRETGPLIFTFTAAGWRLDRPH